MRGILTAVLIGALLGISFAGAAEEPAAEMTPAAEPQPRGASAATEEEHPAAVMPEASTSAAEPKTAPNPAAWDNDKDNDTTMLLLFRFGKQPVVTDTGRYRIHHTEILDIPFASVSQPYVGLLPDKYGTHPLDQSSNLLQKVFPVDQPVLSVFSLKHISTDPKILSSLPYHFVGSRLKVLDSVIVCLYQKDKWGQEMEQYDATFLRFPVDIRAFQMSGTKTGSALHVVDSPFGGVFRMRREEDQKELRVVDTFLAGVFQQRSAGPRSQWTAVPLPMFSAASWEKAGTERRRTVLGTWSENSYLPDWTGHPLLAVWYGTDEADGSSSRQALRLPLLGPVFSTWEAKGEKHWGIFPRLTFWRHYEY